MRGKDRTLLHILSAWVVIAVISVIYVAWKLDNEIFPDHGREQKQLFQPPKTNALNGNRPLRPITSIDHNNTKAEHNSKRDSTYLQPSVKYHTVFSTGCSLYQDWQSYVFFFHAIHSGQEGHITRIASGCEGKAKDEVEKIFKNEIEPIDPERLHLHQTPEYGYIHKQKQAFKYFNKPYGLRHWFENVLGYPENHAEHDDSIIILMDPDQILLRPFTDDFTKSAENWWLPEEGRHKLKVEHGSPFAQNYGYRTEWRWLVNQTYVFQGPTPILQMNEDEIMNYYKGMGAPYIATVKDMYEIVKVWTDVVPRVRNEFPNILAEMFAFNEAVAHLGLRPTIATSFMVSEVGKEGEGWPLVDNVDPKDVCHNFPKSQLPHVFHYCQEYSLGKWFMSKYFLRKDIISCNAPLLEVPPADIALRFKRGINPNGFIIKQLKPKQVLENGFAVCAMIRAINEAALYYKDNHCDKATANYGYSFTFFDDMFMEEDSCGGTAKNETNHARDKRCPH